jgi:plasmid stability protein
VAAFHVRDIPPEWLDRLRERAQKQGRSMNAEMLSMLEEHLSRRTPEEVLASIRARRNRLTWSPDAPKPEDLIRKDRDTDHSRL